MDDYMEDVEDIYGEDVEFRIEEEDRDPITKPLVETFSQKKFSHRIPPTRDDFLLSLMKEDHAVRNVALVGHILHGKTSLVDCLIPKSNFEPKKFTDSLFLEQQRGISIKASPVTIALQSLRGKTYALNLIDTPGHVNFSDEVTAALRITDGVVLVVDVCEGIMMNTWMLLKYAIKQHQSIVLCINKIDRLVLEMRLPPNDAYHKIKKIIDEINKTIDLYVDDKSYLISPIKGNVCFASAKYSTCFTLRSFAQLYLEHSGVRSCTYKQLATKLWGDSYMTTYKCEESGREKTKFVDEPPSRSSKRTFVELILEPLYKLFRVVVEDPDGKFVELTNEYGISLPKKHKSMNVIPLLQIAFSQMFGSFESLMDVIAEFLPSPRAASWKIAHIWTGPTNSKLFESMKNCDPNGPLVVQIVKQYASLSTDFNVFGRVMSGTLKAYSDVKIISESYIESLDEDDIHTMTVRRIWLNNTRFEVEVKEISAGNWALIEGVDQPVTKTCTIVDYSLDESPHIFKPLNFMTKPVVKIAVEPANPSELPKLLEGLRKCNKSYTILRTKVEDSGEHVIIGTGELYLDCVMHDLKKIYSDIDIRVSDPVVCFTETISSLSEYVCIGESQNKKNLFKMIAEPLEYKLAEDLENQKITIESKKSYLDDFLKRRYNWDELSCRSIWAFGPDSQGTNIFLNETLPYEADQNLLNQIKDRITESFHWATREGPLCDEPMRGVKMKLIYANVAREPMQRSDVQIRPTLRRVSHLAFLKAEPRLMEPYFFTEIVAPPDVVKGIQDSSSRHHRSSSSILEDLIVKRRRGQIVKKEQISGTPLYRVEALLPAIDSFGFETDLRLLTTGQAFCQTVFDKWVVVPGDPLDKSIDQYLLTLEPQKNAHLAREFFLKTRKRKGLSEDLDIGMFMDESMHDYLEELEMKEDELKFNIPLQRDK